jgi:purine-cytosine permease-like protein
LGSKESTEKKSFLYDWEKERVPESMTRHWLNLAYIEMGLFASGFGVMMGGLFAGSSWPWYDILAWLIIGNAILLVFYFLIGAIGAKERLPLSFIAERIFGPIGAKVFNLLILIGVLAWAALGIDQIALVITDYTGINVNITAIIALLLILASIIAGYKTIAIVAELAIPLFYVLVLAWTIYYGFQVHWHAWGLNQPWGGYWPSFWSGVTYVVGLNIMASFLCPNYLRYAKSTKDVIKATSTAIITGMVILSFLLSTLAAWALKPTDTFADPGLILLRTLGPVLGGIIAVLLIWTTADNDFWYISLSLVEVYPKISNWVYSILISIGSLAIIYAGWLYQYINFASMLAVIWSAIPGIIIAHYYLLPKIGVNIDIVRLKNIKFNWMPYIAWIAGIIVAYYANKINLPLSSILATVIGLVLYLVLMLFYKERRE